VDCHCPPNWWRKTRIILHKTQFFCFLTTYTLFAYWRSCQPVFVFYPLFGYRYDSSIFVSFGVRRSKRIFSPWCMGVGWVNDKDVTRMRWDKHGCRDSSSNCLWDGLCNDENHCWYTSINLVFFAWCCCKKWIDCREKNKKITDGDVWSEENWGLSVWFVYCRNWSWSWGCGPSSSVIDCGCLDGEYCYSLNLWSCSFASVSFDWWGDDCQFACSVCSLSMDFGVIMFFGESSQTNKNCW